jgi:NADPH-dependent 2,4-dienoyl-CoA reductase/sulfur reductase-like enzyme
MPTRFVIIGAGAAGMAAATTLRSLDSTAEIVVLTDDSYGYYSRPGLAYYLTGEIPERQLFPFSPHELRDMKITLRQGRALAIDPVAHEIALEAGELLSYDRLLLATGSLAAPAELPGAGLEGVVKLDNLEDARRIIAGAQRARAAVVVGGGITALEIAEGLRHRCRNTHYLLRGERYWSNVLDETESAIVEGRLTAEGIRLHRRTELASIEGRDGHVTAVVTKTGERIECGLVAVAIGVQPRVELARSAGLVVDRGVLVDEYFRTSQREVFAAGDVAQVRDPLTGRTVLDTLWSAALDQGRAAASNMAGSATPYIKPPALNVTRLAGLTTTLIGAVGRGRDADLVAIARGDSETWRGTGALTSAISVEDVSEVNRVRMLVGERTLVGAVVMGDQSLSRPLEELVARQVDVSDIRAALLAPGADISGIIGRFWRQWRQHVASQTG